MLLICLCLFIAGCDQFKTTNINTICSQEPAVCEDLHQIGDCRFIRTAVIRARYQHMLSPNEVNTQILLEELNSYKSCLELTLQIAYTRFKDRKQKRLDNFLVSESLIEVLLDDAEGTQDPNLAYYLWTHNQDLQAKKVFLNAAKQPGLSNVSLLSKLAIYHSADDPQLSVDFYYKALKNSQNLDSLPNGLFIQLISILYRHNMYQEAFLWAKVATSSSQNSAPINIDNIVEKGYLSIDAQQKLTLLSTQYILALEEGRFNQKTPNLNKSRSTEPTY